MKLLTFTFLAVIFSSAVSQAQFAMGGAMNMWGTGQWGGQQACPYMGAGGFGGGAVNLEDQVYALEYQIDDINTEISDLENLSHDFWTESRLPFQPNAGSILGGIMQNDGACPEPKSEATAADGSPSSSGSAAYTSELEGKIADRCNQFVKPQKKDVSVLCETSDIYNLGTEEGYRYKGKDASTKFANAQKECREWVKKYKGLLSKRKKAEERLAKAQERFEREEARRERREERAAERGYVLPPEGTYCTGCIIGYPEPEIKTSDKVLALGTDLLSAFAWYKGTQYVSRNNARLGWATPPLALGMPYPLATASLYGAAYGGMGSGSFGCAGMMGGGGYPAGLYGAFGSPYGAFSPYGNFGGYAGFPGSGGYPGFSPGFGGGMYAPGVGPWGMAGPWGGSGFYPPAFGINGMLGLGIGGGLGGLPYGGGFPGAGGYGGLGGYGGFPGAWNGPIGAGFGGFGGPMGGGYGVFPGGGFPGAGGFGGSPYGGGFGSPFGGGYGGFGNPFLGGGLYGGFGSPYGGFGSPFGGGFGSQYQMELMNYQMQMMQAQQRAFQNTQVIQSQAYSLEIEIQELRRRQFQLYQYLQFGGGTVGAPPYQNPPVGGGTGTTPPPIR